MLPVERPFAFTSRRPNVVRSPGYYVSSSTAGGVLALPFISPCSQIARWRPQYTAAGPYCRDPLSRSRAFRIVGKLRGNLFIADQSRAASYAPSHYTLLAPRTSHFTLTRLLPQTLIFALSPFP